MAAPLSNRTRLEQSTPESAESLITNDMSARADPRPTTSGSVDQSDRH